MKGFKLDKKKLQKQCIVLLAMCVILHIASSIQAIRLSSNELFLRYYVFGYIIVTILLTTVSYFIPYLVFRFELYKHREQLKEINTFFDKERHRLQVSVEYLKMLLQDKEGTEC